MYSLNTTELLVGFLERQGFIRGVLINGYLYYFTCFVWQNPVSFVLPL